MEKMNAFCVTVCTQCSALSATKKNYNNERKKTVELLIMKGV